MEHVIEEEVDVSKENLSRILKELDASDQGHEIRIILQTFWNAGFDENAARNCCCNYGLTREPVTFEDSFKDLTK